MLPLTTNIKDNKQHLKIFKNYRKEIELAIIIVKNRAQLNSSYLS